MFSTFKTLSFCRILETFFTATDLIARIEAKQKTLHSKYQFTEALTFSNYNGEWILLNEFNPNC
jgi:hypothetical protein